MNGALLALGVVGGAVVGSAFLPRRGARNHAERTWWHGTDAKNLDAILRQGLRGRAQRGRAMLAPLQGRVYAAKGIDTALVYALGGAVVGIDLGAIPKAAQSHFEGRGAVLALRPTAETHVLPDEDWVGEVVTDRIDRDNSFRYVADHASPQSEAWAARAWNLLPDRTQASIRKIPGHRLNELSIWAKIGKQVVAALGRSPTGQAHLALGARIAPTASFEGSLHIEGAWTFDRLADCSRLGPKGVHALDVMEPHALPGTT